MLVPRPLPCALYTHVRCAALHIPTAPLRPPRCLCFTCIVRFVSFIPIRSRMFESSHLTSLATCCCAVRTALCCTAHYTACVPALCTTLHVLCVRRIRFNLDGDMLLLLEEVEGRQSERGRRAAEREEKRRFDCELEVAALAKAVGPPYTYDPEVSFPPPLFPSLSTEI